MCRNLDDLLYRKDIQEDGGGRKYQDIIENVLQAYSSNKSKPFIFKNLVNLAVANCYQISSGIDFWSLPIF